VREPLEAQLMQCEVLDPDQMFPVEIGFPPTLLHHEGGVFFVAWGISYRIFYVPTGAEIAGMQKQMQLALSRSGPRNGPYIVPDFPDNDSEDSGEDM